MADPIPTRFNSAAVSRYEGVMRQLCSSWPMPILVDPAPLSLETFSQRFRDAVKGVLVYNQGSQELRTMVGKLGDKITVSESSGKLRIGPRTMVNRKSKSAAPVGLLVSGIATLADETSPISSPDAEVIQAIALLTAHGILGGARISGVTEEFIYKSFPEDYEGGAVDNGDGTFTIY